MDFQIFLTAPERVPNQATIPLLHQKTSDIHPQKYNPFKFPPNVSKSKHHALSTRVSKPDLFLKQDLCECCKRNAANQLLSLRCDLRCLNLFGYCTPLFFHTLLFCLGIVVFILFSFGTYSTYLNILGNYSGPTHANNITNQVSFLRVLSSKDDVLMQTLLVLITTGGLIVAFQVFKGYQKKTIQECREEITSASDYAILLSGLKDIYVNKVDIRDFLMINGMIQDIDAVRKVIFTYDISELTRLLRERRKLVHMRNKFTDIMTSINYDREFWQERKEKAREIDKKLKEIEKRLKDVEELCTTSTLGFNFSGAVIVVLNNQIDAKYIKRKWKITWYRWLFIKAMSPFGFFDGYKLKGCLVKVHSVPDPNDILWENAGLTEWKVFRVIKANSITVITILIAAIIEFSMSCIAHYQINEFIARSTISMLASLIVVSVNGLLILIIRKTASHEHHLSYTDYHRSFAEKLIVSQFINTAIVPIFVNLTHYSFLKTSSLIDMLDGLVYDMGFIFMSNAFISPLVSYFDPWYIFKLWQQRKLVIDSKYNFMIQSEANALFEGPQFDIASSYAALIKTIWLTAFYAPLMPLCIPISFIGLSIKYGIDKYIFLRRCAVPPFMGKDLAKAMVKYLELTPFVFALGNLLINICAAPTDEKFDFSLTLSTSTTILGFFWLLIPFAFSFRRYMKVNNRNLYHFPSYDSVKLHTDYHLTNPIEAASKEAEEWEAYINSLKDINVKESLKASLKDYKRSQAFEKRHLERYVSRHEDLQEVCKSFIQKKGRHWDQIESLQNQPDWANMMYKYQCSDITLVKSELVNYLKMPCNNDYRNDYNL